MTFSDLAPMLLWETDANGSAASIDSRWLKYTGQTPEETQDLGWLDAIHPDDRPNMARVFGDLFGTGQALEHRIRRNDGIYRWFLVRQIPVYDDRGDVTRWLGAAADIHTQRTALEAVERQVVERTGERDALRRRLVEVEEAERRRLARDLHDEAGQHLAALGLGLQSLSDISPQGSEIDRRVQQLRELANTLAGELHAVSVRLRPRALDDFGLEAAISAAAEDSARHSGIAIDVHVQRDEHLPATVETAIYRIVQEALTNVARHSGASRASVVVERRNRIVVAVIEDNGRGFDVELEKKRAHNEGRLGLVSMQERAVLVGGELDVESSPKNGTTVYARLPAR